MKIVAQVLGGLGIVICILAVIGRYRYLDTVTVFGETHSASALLLVGNTLLLTAILVLLCPCRHKHDE